MCQSEEGPKSGEYGTAHELSKQTLEQQYLAKLATLERWSVEEAGVKKLSFVYFALHRQEPEKGQNSIKFKNKKLNKICRRRIEIEEKNNET